MRARTLALLTGLLVAFAGSAAAQPPDPLDRLVGLVEERLNTADAIAAAKWADAAREGVPPRIDDPEREALVYVAMVRLGAEHGLPAPRVRAVFTGQIEAGKTVQYGLVTRWRFDPAAAPATPPDLSELRRVIDRLNTGIVIELAAHRALLAAPDCAVRLAPSVFARFPAADALHRAALVRASVALCGPA